MLKLFLILYIMLKEYNFQKILDAINRQYQLTNNTVKAQPTGLRFFSSLEQTLNTKMLDRNSKAKTLPYLSYN